MITHLTQSVIKKFEHKDKAYWVTDKGCKNLRLYVGAKAKVWYVGYRAKGHRNYTNHKLGDADDRITVAQAREMANDFMVRLLRGESPQTKQVPKRKVSDFLDHDYEPWILKNHRTGAKTMSMMRSAFRFLLPRYIDEITKTEIEKWRTDQQAVLKRNTINKRLSSLNAALEWGVEFGHIERNPIEGMKRLKENDSDADGKDHYLTDAQRESLMSAIDAREKEIRDKRTSHNNFLVARGLSPMPALRGEYADHIKPMILVSLNTGMRRGNLFQLKWSDLNMTPGSETVTLRTSVTKAGRSIKIPLNAEVVRVFKLWRAQFDVIGEDDLVFPSPKTGKAFDNCQSAWEKILKEACIEGFRWHDMRHDFASRLTMMSVPLNTIRELMGHSDLTMTMRYAHLAPEARRDAVNKLGANTGNHLPE